MTKADIVDSVCKNTGLSKQKSITLVETLFELIQEQLAQGGAVKLSGFGVFNVRAKKPRPGRNPKTGEAVEIAARTVVTFKPSPRVLGPDTVNFPRR